MQGQSIKLKALMEREKDRVLFAEADKDFIDILFSFLTLSMGAIVRLTRNLSQTSTIGSLNNLYKSIEKLDVSCFTTEECKRMLLQPRNGAANQYKDLKLKTDDGEPLCYYSCSFHNAYYRCTVYSHYIGSICNHGNPRDQLVELKGTDARDGGVFVEGQTRLVITDELEMMPPSSAAIFSMLSKLGSMDASFVEERTFNIGDEGFHWGIQTVLGVLEFILIQISVVLVSYFINLFDDLSLDDSKLGLNLLKSSLVSKTALTATLLKLQGIPEESNDESFGVEGLSIKHEEEKNGMIRLKLLLSKSKKIVWYADADLAFVDLLFSFLTVPLGYIMKNMNGAPSKGCIPHLYKSIQVIDDGKYFKSYELENSLLCPKIQPGFDYKNQLLDLEVAEIQIGSIPLTIIDPNLPPYKEDKSNGGFLTGPAMFTVTNDLNITPISVFTGMTILSKLKVPFSDIEVVHVGKKEALKLLIVSFISKSALTDTFVSKFQNKNITEKPNTFTFICNSDECNE